MRTITRLSSAEKVHTADFDFWKILYSATELEARYQHRHFLANFANFSRLTLFQKRDSGIGIFLWIFKNSKSTYFVDHLWMGMATSNVWLLLDSFKMENMSMYLLNIFNDSRDNNHITYSYAQIHTPVFFTKNNKNLVVFYCLKRNEVLVIKICNL